MENKWKGVKKNEPDDGDTIATEDSNNEEEGSDGWSECKWIPNGTKRKKKAGKIRKKE